MSSSFKKGDLVRVSNKAYAQHHWGKLGLVTRIFEFGRSYLINVLLEGNHERPFRREELEVINENR